MVDCLFTDKHNDTASYMKCLTVLLLSFWKGFRGPRKQSGSNYKRLLLKEMVGIYKKKPVTVHLKGMLLASKGSNSLALINHKY